MVRADLEADDSCAGGEPEVLKDAGGGRRIVRVGRTVHRPPDGLVDLAANVMAKTNRTVERLAALGLEPQRSWVDAGLLPSFWERQAWVVAHRHELS